MSRKKLSAVLARHPFSAAKLFFGSLKQADMLFNVVFLQNLTRKTNRYTTIKQIIEFDTEPNEDYSC